MLAVIEAIAIGTGERVDGVRVALEVQPTSMARVGDAAAEATLAQQLGKVVVLFVENEATGVGQCHSRGLFHRRRCCCCRSGRGRCLHPRQRSTRRFRSSGGMSISIDHGHIEVQLGPCWLPHSLRQSCRVEGDRRNLLGFGRALVGQVDIEDVGDAFLGKVIAGVALAQQAQQQLGHVRVDLLHQCALGKTLPQWALQRGSGGGGGVALVGRRCLAFGAFVGQKCSKGLVVGCWRWLRLSEIRGERNLGLRSQGLAGARRPNLARCPIGIDEGNHGARVLVLWLLLLFACSLEETRIATKATGHDRFELCLAKDVAKIVFLREIKKDGLDKATIVLKPNLDKDTIGLVQRPRLHKRAHLDLARLSWLLPAEQRRPLLLLRLLLLEHVRVGRYTTCLATAMMLPEKRAAAVDAILGAELDDRNARLIEARGTMWW